jgi:hypothetical protein
VAYRPMTMVDLAGHLRRQQDLRTLAGIVGITALGPALTLCERFFPGDPLPSRSRAMLEDLFG